MSAINVFVIYSIILTTILSAVVNCARLRGVTLQSKPFIVRDGNQYKGYIIDVLDAMRNISDFDYYLYEVQELGTIDKRHGNVSGLLGEVRTNSADFGVSDIEATEERKRLVDFTDPVLNYSTSALIHYSNLGTMRSFQDLADQTRVTYGALRNSSTMKLFEMSDDIVVQRMYALMKSRGVSADSLKEAEERVRTTKYAFIADSLTIEGLAQNDCDLAVIRADGKYFRRHISITLPMGSKFLTIFNQFIKQLTESGKLSQIRHKYWKRSCFDILNASSKQNSSINLFFVLNFLFICSKMLF